MSHAPTLLVTVLYNSTPVLTDWLAGVRRLRAESAFPIVTSVVDNASSDDTVARLRAALRDDDAIHLTAHSDNAGWGAGNNRALAASRDLGPFEVVVFLNPDVILDAPAHDAMRAALAADPLAAAAVPRLRDPDANLRVPAFPNYSLADALLGFAGWRGFKSARWQKPRDAGTIANLHGGYAEGSCVMVRNAALLLAGQFDEAFFMYFDDTDLTRRLVANGDHVLFLPDAIATDLPGKGSRVHTDRAENRLDRYVFYLASELRYYEKLHSRATARALARFKLLVDLPLRSLLWRLRYGIRGTSARCRPIVRDFLRDPA